jgi:transcription antitermination protein NusB
MTDKSVHTDADVWEDSPAVTDQTPIDQRHVRRIKLMQSLFATTFNEVLQDGDPLAITHKLVENKEIQAAVELILTDLPEIDVKLQQFAPERPLSDINQVDLAILRLIYWEAEHKKTPKKVLIDEAVELAKEFGSDSSPRFVNGVLGKLLMQN